MRIYSVSPWNSLMAFSLLTSRNFLRCTRQSERSIECGFRKFMSRDSAWTLGKRFQIASKTSAEQLSLKLSSLLSNEWMKWQTSPPDTASVKIFSLGLDCWHFNVFFAVAYKFPFHTKAQHEKFPFLSWNIASQSFNERMRTFQLRTMRYVITLVHCLSISINIFSVSKNSWQFRWIIQATNEWASKHFSHFCKWENSWMPFRDNSQ